MKRTILLTGATGLLGRYLLRELLRRGRPVAVLVRPGRDTAPAARVEALLAGWDEPLPRPTVLDGEIAPDGVGLTPADRRWLRRHVGTVLHAAASTAFRETPDGEPWRTNVGGTDALLRLARELGVAAWHHVSTAFVCGRRRGRVAPDDLDDRAGFHNAYERSKHAAERAVRAAVGPGATVYRPAVIVGDSASGFTSSYAGLYRFLALAARLAEPGRAGRSLPLRLALRGDEPCNLVPVDWVARAIATIVDRPGLHDRSYHLVARRPTPVRAIYETATAVLGLRGVELVGPGGDAEPTRLEELFRAGVADYWPYLQGCPDFCDRTTAAALPELPPPPVDRASLGRLIRFAQTDNWGRGEADGAAADAADAADGPGCAAYFEQTFPRQARASSLARAIGLDVLVGFAVRGPDGGLWSCRWTRGEFRYVRRGLEPGAAAVYHTDAPTMWAIVRGELTPQQAFFEQRITITGDLELALKLVVLFEQFLRETGAEPFLVEASDAAAR